MEKRINHKNLKKFISKVLKKVGLDKHSRMSVTTGLYEASLRGVDSHGVRLLNHYVLSAVKGRKNPKPNYKFYKSFCWQLIGGSFKNRDGVRINNSFIVR